MGLSLFFLLFISVNAVVVSLPSNTTDIHIQSTGFRIEGATLTGQKLVPLTQSLIESTTVKLKTFNISGTATQVIPSNSLNLQRSQIACISCDQDDYTGNIRVDKTIEYVTSAQSASVILLYSKTAIGCNFTSDDQTAERFPNIFTFTSRTGYPALLRAFDQPTTISIASMSNYIAGVPTDEDSGSTGNSPNTAMIILYSITGIITALFLGIIITGAVRAHRHPERYGPRRIAGRVRQSRARGIARAMLDTIPVVKFDDKNDDVEAAKRDVEMSMGDDAARDFPQADGNTTGASTPRESEMSTPDNERPTPTAPEAKTEMPDAGNFSCPICTDDFIKGQDLRVLPCNHQFHMECIDPWLMNVSGTCPLCRIDLNPPQPENPEETEENADQPDQPRPEGAVLTTEEARQQARQQARHTHRRLTNYLHGPLNARRMRDATVEERLAALRRVREANQGDSAPEEGPHRGLTTRLRDRFRIRTRAHGAEGETSDADAAPSPAAPAAVHLPPSTA
ncbi:Zinc finger RING-type [Penicillium fimorum]|uniref:Zinc finger RING-type n=1 Tax=Penicillium fimorum TaxID=1882269 RepID=A0A9W9XSY5_9EURO|nr:Zinc finger RING-type [Penicillium fimorum]